MKLAAHLLLIAGLLPTLSGADWIRLSTPNFEMYASCPEQKARETLEIFEEARVFFSRAMPVRNWSSFPVTLVMFGNAKDYQPFSPGPSKPAYFVGTEQRDYIVMSDVGDYQKIAAIHEYVHLLVHHSGLSLPLWLNEGLADVYSTLREENGRIVAGTIPTDRARSLTSQSWLKMPVLMNVDARSPEYRETDKAGVFYGQSWLLAHMLLFDPVYKGSFTKFLDRISETTPAQAFSDVYRQSLADIERAMNNYFRRESIGAQSFDRPKTDIQIGAAASATELQTGVVLATLSTMSGRPEEALKRLQPLAVAHPQSIEVEEILAYSLLASGDIEGGLEHLEEARARGRERWRTDWDYARILLLEDSNYDLAKRALLRVLQEKPDMQAARILVATTSLWLRDYEGAWDDLEQIRNVQPRYQVIFLVTKAGAASGLGREADARRFTEEARKRAQRPEEIAVLEKLFEWFQRIQPVQPQTDGDAFSPEEEVERPVLRRTPPAKPKGK